MNQTFDYTNVTRALINGVKDATGNLLIAANTSGQAPPFPYCTYTITSPKIAIQHEYENAEFEIVVSLTWHDATQVGVLNLAKKMESYFTSTAGRQTLANEGIVLADVLNFSERDNFLSIDYERLAGVDLRLRVRDAYTDEVGAIDSIRINNL